MKQKERTKGIPASPRKIESGRAGVSGAGTLEGNRNGNGEMVRAKIGAKGPETAGEQGGRGK